MLCCYLRCSRRAVCVLKCYCTATALHLQCSAVGVMGRMAYIYMGCDLRISHKPLAGAKHETPAARGRSDSSGFLRALKP